MLNYQSREVLYKLPEIQDMPTIGLYMDQLLELLDGYLNSCKRSPVDVIFTKTMINNYVKSGIITAPIKKRYHLDSMIELIMVYYFKQVLSINDTATVIHQIRLSEPKNPVKSYLKFKATLEAVASDALSQPSLEPLDETLRMVLDAALKKMWSERLIDSLNQDHTS